MHRFAVLLLCAVLAVGLLLVPAHVRRTPARPRVLRPRPEVLLPRPKELPSSKGPVTHAAYERIAREMTQAEIGALAGPVLPPLRWGFPPEMTRGRIEAILGGPPGDYRTRPVELEMDEAILAAPFGTRIMETTLESWQCDEGSVFVSFYPDGTVDEVNFISALGIPAMKR